MELSISWVFIFFGLTILLVRWCLRRVDMRIAGIEARMVNAENSVENIETYISDKNDGYLIMELDGSWYDTYFQGDKHFVTFDYYGNLVISFKEENQDG